MGQNSTRPDNEGVRPRSDHESIPTVPAMRVRSVIHRLMPNAARVRVWASAPGEKVCVSRDASTIHVPPPSARGAGAA